MARFFDPTDRVTEMYLKMDPHQLDNSQLDYEADMRDISLYGPARRQANTLKRHLFNESAADGQAYEYLYHSPRTAEEDIKECQRMCRNLENESRSGRIDSLTLDRLWSRVVHVIARLNRIVTAEPQKIRDKFETLYWAESIRQRVEEQKDPFRDFIPCVQIDETYHHIPEFVSITNVNDVATNDAPPNEQQMNEIAQRFGNIPVISQLYGSTGSNTATTATTSTAAQSVLSSISTSTPIRTAMNVQPTEQRPVIATTRLNIPNDQPITTATSRTFVDAPTTASTASNAKHTGTIPKVPFSLNNVVITTTLGSSARFLSNPIYSTANIAPIASTREHPASGIVPPSQVNHQLALEWRQPPPTDTTANAIHSNNREYPNAILEAIRQRKTQKEKQRLAKNATNVRITRSESMSTWQNSVVPFTQRTLPSITPPTSAATIRAPTSTHHAQQNVPITDNHARRPWPVTIVHTAPPTNLRPNVFPFPSPYGYGPHTAFYQLPQPQTTQMQRPPSRIEIATQGQILPAPPAGHDIDRHTRNSVASRHSGRHNERRNHQDDGANNSHRRDTSHERSSASHRSQRSIGTRENRDDRSPERPVRRQRTPVPADSPPSSDGHDSDHHHRRDRRSRHNTPSVKPVPVNQWRISFSGDSNPTNKHDLKIHNFIEQVELFRRASSISEADLLLQVIHLLAGSARAWFQNKSRHIRSWRQFVQALRANFLPSDYNFDLITQANQRRQRKEETAAEYINAMELIFRAMSVPMAPELQLCLVRQNLRREYGTHVAAQGPRSITDVKRICKDIESAHAMQSRRDSDAPKTTTGREKKFYRSVQATERVSEPSSDNNSSSDSESERNVCAAARSNSDKKHSRNKADEAKSKSPKSQVEACYNCRSSGHNQYQCKLKWKKHCYNCGKPDYVTKDCPECNEEQQKPPKNAQVSQADMEPEDSQSDTAS